MKNPFARKRILAVCTGNTCRSPMVEAILRNEMSFFKRLRYTVESAGVNGFAGDSISENSVDALAEIGIDASNHVVRKLTPSMAKEADLILCLSNSHRHACEDMGANCMITVMGISDPYCKPIESYRDTMCEIMFKLEGLSLI